MPASEPASATPPALAIVPAAPPAPAVPIATLAATLIRVRAISASHGHQVDSIVTIPADELADALAAGWADDNAASVAEAQRLAKLDRANQGREKRYDLMNDKSRD